MDLVLFGIQGSGKGTLGKALADAFELEIFETGAELRKLSKLDTELARKVKSIIEAGHLVPNTVVMDIIANFMAQLPSGKNVLFDGIPRNLEQAETFDTLLKKLNRSFIGLLLDLNQELALQRLGTRRLCLNCKTVYPAAYIKNTCEKCGGALGTRSDDNPESIAVRIKAFFNETTPVLDRYKKAEKMIVIDASKSIDEVKNDAIKSLQDKLL